jgi:polysaccharide pyruvyl transferase WcaK-like protein
MAPLPVSFNSFEADLPAIEAVIGKQAHEWPLDDPHAVATAAGRCRIVITAAYHAAVFALAQGVPCLCLYASAYYKEKMMGLSAQFEDGCSQVDLNEASAKDICKAAIELWERSSDYRTVLRDRAAAQVKISQAFTENALRRSEGTLRSGLRRSRTLISV